MNYAWISGTRFYWVNRTKIYSIEGSASGVLDLSKAKSFWMEGPLLCYYDTYGRRRSIQMSSLSPRDIDATKQKRAVWVPEGGLFEMRDSSGERRRLVHLDHSDDSHTDYADYDDVASESGTTHLDQAHVDSWFFYDQPAEYHEHDDTVTYSDSAYSQHFDYTDIDHGDRTVPHKDIPYVDWEKHIVVPHSDRPYAEHDDWIDGGHTDHDDHNDAYPDIPWEDIW